MTQEIENIQEQDTPSETEEKTEPVPRKTGVGIVGDSTNHDIVMTKIHIYEDDVIKIKINMIGEEFSECRAKRLEEQLQNRSLDDAKLVLDYDYYKQKHFNDYPLDVLYESIIRAIDNLKEYVQPEPSQDITEENETESSEIVDDTDTKSDEGSSENQIS